MVISLIRKEFLCCSFCSTGAWTQGLQLEPLHQPFVMSFSEIGSQTVCRSRFWTSIIFDLCLLTWLKSRSPICSFDPLKIYGIYIFRQVKSECRKRQPWYEVLEAVFKRPDGLAIPEKWSMGLSPSLAQLQFSPFVIGRRRGWRSAITCFVF
jgi:hypothetical protein